MSGRDDSSSSRTLRRAIRAREIWDLPLAWEVPEACSPFRLLTHLEQQTLQRNADVSVHVLHKICGAEGKLTGCNRLLTCRSQSAWSYAIKTSFANVKPPMLPLKVN
jgi:hypothetical protein